MQLLIPTRWIYARAAETGEYSLPLFIGRLLVSPCLFSSNNYYNSPNEIVTSGFKKQNGISFAFCFNAIIVMTIFACLSNVIGCGTLILNLHIMKNSPLRNWLTKVGRIGLANCGNTSLSCFHARIFHGRFKNIVCKQKWRKAEWKFAACIVNQFIFILISWNNY